MILSPPQIQELLDVIEHQHIMFLGTHLGSDLLSKQDVEILNKHGVNPRTFPKHGVVDRAFHFGILADALGKAEAKQLSFEDFKKHLSSGKLHPLTKAEQVSLDHVKVRMYGDVKGLGNKVSRDFRNIIIEASKKTRGEYESIINQTAYDAVKLQKTASQLASDLGHKTKDWARDFDRISDYVLHEAYDTGKSVSMVNKSKEEERIVWCYKEVYPGACTHCVRLYLTGGVGSKPKIFKISTLISNGTNIGRKPLQWKAVLGSVHPYCRCELFELPENHMWDEEKNEFILKRNTYGIKRKSKIKVIIE